MGRRRRVLLLLAGLGAALLAAGSLAWAIRPLWIPFGLAVGIAYLIAPLVTALEGRGIRRSRAIIMIYIGLGLGTAVFLLRVLPAAYSELQRLARSVPEWAAGARHLLDAAQARVRADGMPPGVREAFEAALTRLETMSAGVVQGLVTNLFRLVEWALYLALAPILAYYMLRDLHLLRAGAVRTLPRRWRRPAQELLHGIDGVLAGFVRGQVVLAVAVGGLGALAAYLLGLRYSLLLGVWAGIAELVPYVGPIIGAVPAMAAGAAVSPVRGVQVALAFALIQQLENAVLGPKVIGEAVGLHPLTVLAAVLAGGYLGGVAGLVLAVPLVGVARVLWLFACRRLVAPRPAPFGPGPPA